MSQLREITDCAVLALAVGSASFTVARTKVSRPFREWVAQRSTWFGNLVTCPYCTSHWLAAIAIALYRPRPVEMTPVLDWGVAWLATVALSAAVIGVITNTSAPNPPISNTSAGSGPRVP